MFQWNEEMVRFMRDASEYSDYHRRLVQWMLPDLHPGDHICDAGCGLGYLSLDRATPSLSTGELQRLRLATQLSSMLFGVVYVLDEPSAGVDFQGEHLFCELLDELRAAKGFTQLMVSHDLGMVFHHATHVICLKRHVFAEGTPDEVLTQENLMALFGMHMGLINPHAPTADQPKDHHA